MITDSEDSELLQRFVEKRSEAAFAELVRRHLDLVYGCALRRVGGDAPLAEDVTQQVFSTLARQAAGLRRHEVLAGWLYTATRFVAAQAVRAERRRRAREQAAFTMNELQNDPAPIAEWERLRPVLDDTIDDLDEADRVAVVLRFFEGKSFSDVGMRLRVTENTARMRVDRALDKLHALLARRGIRSTAAALGLVLTSHAAIVAPAGLGTSITSAALASGAASGALAGGAFAGFMSITKLQFGLAAAVAIGGTAGYVIQADRGARLRQEIDGWRAQASQLPALQAEATRLARVATEVAEWRKDDAELLRLRDEVAALQVPRRVPVTAARRAAGTNQLPADRSGLVYPAVALDQPPRSTHQAPPKYPAEFRKAGVVGEATVEFVVDTEGAVLTAVAVASTHQEFAVAAVEAVKQWKFEPGQKSGQRVPAQMRMPIKFTLGPDQVAATWF